MTTFLLAFVLIAMAIAGLTLRVLLGGAPIKGTCGTTHCQKGIACGACPHRTEEGERR